MQPAIQDITVRQGDRFDLLVRLREKIWNPTGGGGGGAWEPGAYVDLTGKTVRSQIRNNEADTTVRATFTPTILNQGTTPGGCLLSLLPVDTAALIQGGMYDVEIETTATPTDRETFLAGAVTLVKEITRP